VLTTSLQLYILALPDDSAVSTPSGAAMVRHTDCRDYNSYGQVARVVRTGKTPFVSIPA
jgi:hypothetical protein